MLIIIEINVISVLVYLTLQMMMIIKKGEFQTFLYQIRKNFSIGKRLVKVNRIRPLFLELTSDGNIRLEAVDFFQH